MPKDDLRKEIQVLTEKYLMEGNQVDVIPSRLVLPHNHRWMADYGWDYMPWELMGVASYGQFLASDNAVSLGEGCYMSYSKPTED